MKKLIYLFISTILLGCTNEPIPKPIGYFRIDLPEKKYKVIDSIPFPFTFKLPQYAKLNLEKTIEDSRFLNVDFPKFSARLHMSYIAVDSNFYKLVEDSRALVYKHVEKAQDIGEQQVFDKSRKVYGMFYGLDGNTASGSQFYVTDSINHFLRGALYFNVIPNYDSISPVQEFIKKDIEQLIESIEWEK